MGRGGFEPPTHGFSVRHSDRKRLIGKGLQRVFQPETRITSGLQVNKWKHMVFESGLQVATDTFLAPFLQ